MPDKELQNQGIAQHRPDLYWKAKLTETERLLMKEGYIMTYCEDCQDSTWHKPLNIKKAFLGTRKQCGYTDTYQCSKCGKRKTWKYRPKVNPQ